MRARRSGPEGGFTLVELLVTVAILGVLAAIAIPTFLAMRDRGSDGAAQAQMRNALQAVQAFHVINARYTDSEAEIRGIDDTLRWGRSSGVDTAMTRDQDVGIIYFEQGSVPDSVVLGTRSRSGRCYFISVRGDLVYRRSGACQDPWNDRGTTSTTW